MLLRMRQVLELGHAQDAGIVRLLSGIGKQAGPARCPISEYLVEE
jgi:hypothetical protein